MERITAAVWEWLKACPFIADLYLLFGEVENGVCIFAPIGETEEVFIDGARRRQYRGRVTLFENFCPAPNEYVSGGAFARLASIAGWIEEMAAAGRFPALDADCQIQRLFVLPDGGQSNLKSNGWAEYRLEFAIEYIIDGREGYGSMV